MYAMASVMVKVYHALSLAYTNTKVISGENR